MKQFLNSIYMALNNSNSILVQVIYVIATIVENYLLMTIFLTFLNLKPNKAKKIIYIILMSVISKLTSIFLSASINVIINYIAMLILIKTIFKINWLKSFVALFSSIFSFALLNTIIQKPYITILNINKEELTNIPQYRIFYLIILYLITYIICIILKHIKNAKFTLEVLDSIDRKTKLLLLLNLIVGFMTICIQLITTTFYIDIVPFIMTFFNFILLIVFLFLSIYSFTRMVKLANTRRDLQNAEEYNKSLEILYDKVKGFKHDFDNIISSLDGYIENNDISGLKTYFKEVKKDCKITNNLSILNPRIINNPGIYSLLNNKYFKATNAGIRFDIDFFLDLNNLPINIYKFSRILGILLDNAIEEAEKCKDKIVRISFRRENKNRRAIILIENTYSNKDVNVDDIFKKGVSGKENHSGIGLWEVRNYIKRSKNLDLYTSKNSEFFKQELAIYDIDNGNTTI